MSGWLREGRVKYREDITDGLENAPRELIGLLKGENFGKKIIRVSAGPDAALDFMTGGRKQPIRLGVVPRGRVATVSHGFRKSAQGDLQHSRRAICGTSGYCDTRRWCYLRYWQGWQARSPTKSVGVIHGVGEPTPQITP